MPKRGRFSFPVLVGISVLILALGVISLLSGALGKSLLGDIGLPGWLSVPQPHPELPAGVVFHLLGFPITNSIIAAWLSIIILVGIFYAATRRVKLVPTRLQIMLESALGWLLNLLTEVKQPAEGRLC